MLAVASPGPYDVTVALGALLLLTAVVVARRRPRAGRALRVAIGLVLSADIVAYITGEIVARTFSASGSLPLALCNALVVVAAYACFTVNPFAIELTWFLGLAGSLEGLLTPDLSTPFPHLVFFEYLFGHLAVVGAALVLVLGLGHIPRRGAVARVFTVTFAYAAIVGIVDWTNGANYLFLRRPPGNWTVLRLLGPWPVYLPVAAALALALFMVLDAPFRTTRRRRPVSDVTRSPALIWSVVVALAVVVFPLMFVLRRRDVRWRLLLISGRLVRRAAGVPIEVHGDLPRGPVIVCPNHSSFIDGLVVVLALGPIGPLTFLVSQAISRQVIAGTFLRLIGASFVGADGASPRELLGGLAQQLASGHPVVVFPEGSVASGPLRRFHLGAFVLARTSGVPIVPLAIRGAASVLPPGSKRPRPGAISVVVAAPIPVEGDGFRAARALADETRRVLKTLLDEAPPDALRPDALRPDEPMPDVSPLGDALRRGGD